MSYTSIEEYSNTYQHKLQKEKDAMDFQKLQKTELIASINNISFSRKISIATFIVAGFSLVISIASLLVAIFK
ncbi:MAG: hypothetical protein IKJ48_03955 [Alistipes sp.]|nr:hypothetical protein [Alistipes sp.]